MDRTPKHEWMGHPCRVDRTLKHKKHFVRYHSHRFLLKTVTDDLM